MSDLFLEDFCEQPWGGGLHIVFADDVDRLRLDLSPTHSDSPTSLSLIGVTGDEAAVRSSLIDDRWSILDMLPSLSIGSAPGGRFAISDRRLHDFGQKKENLDEQFTVWRDLFGDKNPEYQATENAMRSFGEFARASPAVRVIQHLDSKSRASDWFVGRVGLRPAVGNLVRALWGNDRDAREYLFSAISCGQWRLLTDIDQHLDPHPFDPASAASSFIIRGLEAIRFLDEELARLLRSRPDALPDVHGQHHIEERWKQVAAKLETLGTSDKEQRIYRAYLGARYARLYWADAQQAANLVRSAFDRIEQVIEGSMSEVAPSSVREASLRDIAATTLQLASIDTEIGGKMFERLAKLHWRTLPPPLLDDLRRMVLRLSSRHGLGAMLSRASERATVEELIALHSAEPTRVFFCLSAVSSKQVRVQARGEEWRARHLVAIGAAISDIQSSLKLHPEDLPRPEVLKRDLVEIATSSQGNAVLDYMTSPDAKLRLQTLIAKRAEHEVLDIEGVLDLELERVLRVSGEVLRQRPC